MYATYIRPGVTFFIPRTEFDHDSLANCTSVLHLPHLVCKARFLHPAHRK